MLPIPVWKCDALGAIVMPCEGMNIPGGNMAGDTWVLWLAERMSVFAGGAGQTGFREGDGVGRRASQRRPSPQRVEISFRAELRPPEVHDASRHLN
jgi:hypothetical protein